jgi:hypothetical protein
MKLSFTRLGTATAPTLAAAAIALSAPATASADVIDDSLAALPSGEITCAQATKYWTNESDYNSKVAQATTLALFDSRGPQIRAALSRVDEAANRCGLKAGATATPAPSPTPDTPVENNPAPGALTATTEINLAPAGTPAIPIAVPGYGTVTIPDLLQIVRQFLAGFGITI